MLEKLSNYMYYIHNQQINQLLTNTKLSMNLGLTKNKPKILPNLTK